MEAIDKQYQTALEQLKGMIQESEALSLYLDTEEEEHYKSLQLEIEPQIAEVYNYVADKSPLQLEAFERALLDEGFEGLFLPKILGYSVLRGDVDQTIKYRKPQDHFKTILLAIASSANYEMIKNRIGQTIQIGFALSSDIWITNLLNSIENKKIRAFFSSCKLDKFRELSKRKEAFISYKNQFANANFQSTDFPENDIELEAEFFSIRNFLIYRASQNLDNTSLLAHVDSFINSDKFTSSDEFIEIMLIIGLMFDADAKLSADYSKRMNAIIKSEPNFDKRFFEIYDNLYSDKSFKIMPANEIQLGSLLAGGDNAGINEYFETVSELHSKGFVHPDAIEKIRKYYEQHDGMSLQNECLRSSVIGYMTRLLNNFEPADFSDYVELNKIITVYIGIFSNEEFNQEIKSASMNYIAKCLKVFIDKRGKEYQDMKKYVSTTYKDLKFLTDKEIVELFKTKRVKVEEK